MPWVALIGVGLSAYAASRQKSGASAATQGLANQQAAMSADQWNTYNTLYKPRQEQLLNDVFDKSTTPTAEAARAGAEASRAAATSEQVGLRNARRLGINLNSPAAVGLNRQAQADRAGLVAAAKTYGRRYAVETNTQRQLQALGMGSGLPGSAASMNQSAYSMQAGLDAVKRSDENAKGQLYGQAAGYLTSGLSSYLKGRQVDQLTENDPNSLER